MAAKHTESDAPGLAHPTVVPTNADVDERCPECGSTTDEE